MPQHPPAHVGDAIAAIDTPALVLDLDAFARNVDRMANSAHGIRLRPHAKAHKCPEIARLQIAAGAIGVCCQKTASRATVGVLTDDASNVLALSAAATQSAVTLDVYVEVDVGAHRCGVAPDAAVTLAQQIAVAAGLRFRGLHAYHGGAQHLRDPEERAAAIAAAGELARAARDAIEDAGIHCAVVTGAGTGTWRHERDSGIWNELQPGSYVFMDADYQRNTLAPDEMRFEQSRPGATYVKATDEHGVIDLDAGAAPLARNDRVWLVPGHCDPTVNLYDWIVGFRRDRVEAVFSVAARGALG